MNNITTTGLCFIVAGNSIARPFEVDQRQAENYRYGPKVVHLKFEIR